MVSNRIRKYPGDMLFHKHRLNTFKNWAYPDNAPCSSYKVSEAGFYAVDQESENNLASCWVCHKTMYWDEDDDPKTEHANHSPDCHFVKIALNKKEGDLTFQELITLYGESVVNYKEKRKAIYMNKLKNDLDDFKKQFRNFLK